ncbi:helix-turn-helix domain-containing protein [Actinocorallia populi]|uniref:helix-turn-helix domain-containing protein n=1 Tax=Actinocorallia populi TaxID=2079200 RepID=UPI000D095B23|nr:helix-turn-helix transcriptional regulator [Actinocorallia populi]
MDEVTWDELRKELIEPEDEPLIEEQRRRLIARQRAYKLVEARQRRGLRQIDIAEVMGVSQARVSQIEHGVISEVATLAAYVAALGGQLKVVADFGDDTMVLDVPGGKRAS